MELDHNFDFSSIFSILCDAAKIDIISIGSLLATKFQRIRMEFI